MSEDARFRKGFLLALVVSITAAFVFVISGFLMTIFVAAIFSGLAHPLYSRLRKALGGREAIASAMTLLMIVLLVAIAMALDHLGIGRSILPLAFGIVFGGVVLAAALAVGLGARDVVSRTLEQQLHESSRPNDKVDHV